MNGRNIYCADIIARYGDQFVIIQRINSDDGLALPGGKQESGEMLSLTAVREFEEETGMRLEIEAVLGTYAEDDRDPRGQYISTVFVGEASGSPKDEQSKTHVMIMSQAEILRRRRYFLFDHFQILMDYFEQDPLPIKKKGRKPAMSVRFVDAKPDKSVIKRAVCHSCGAKLEYVPNDVLKYSGRDYSGGPDGREWIVCPNCGKDVTLRSW